MNLTDVKMSQAGYMGCEYIDDTAAHIGPYSKIRALSATETNTITIGAEAITDNITLAIDQVIEGRITQLTLASGTVLAYTETA